MRKRLLAAVAAYLVIGLMAALTLTGLFRTAVWIFLGGLALRTLIAFQVEQSQESANPPNPQSASASQSE